MATQLTLVLGGIASGKSAHAEALAQTAGKPLIYLATAQAFDAEMRSKIARHKAARGPGWQVVEEPLAIAQALRTLPPGHMALFDCATMWLSNHLLAESDLAAERTALLAALSERPCDLVIVSNETGLGGISDNALARRFAAEQGALNQALATLATRVDLVAAGLPLTLKKAAP